MTTSPKCAECGKPESWVLHDEKHWGSDHPPADSHPFEPLEEPEPKPRPRAAAAPPAASSSTEDGGPRCTVCGLFGGPRHRGSKAAGHKFTTDRAAAMRDPKLMPTAANKRAAKKARPTRKPRAVAAKKEKPRPIAMYGRISELAHRVDELRRELEDAVTELKEAIA